LTHFVQAAKNQCPKEMQQGNVEKFLCRICKIDFGIIKFWFLFILIIAYYKYT